MRTIKLSLDAVMYREQWLPHTLSGWLLTTLLSLGNQPWWWTCKYWWLPKSTLVILIVHFITPMTGKVHSHEFWGLSLSNVFLQCTLRSQTEVVNISVISTQFLFIYFHFKLVMHQWFSGLTHGKKQGVSCISCTCMIFTLHFWFCFYHHKTPYTLTTALSHRLTVPTDLRAASYYVIGR